MPYTPAEIATVCHEANRALQRVQLDHAARGSTTGIPVAAPWPEFSEQAGVIRGVVTALTGTTPEELHEAWCEHKRADGWTYGPVKDGERREHPCLVDYDQLPAEQRVKDDLFAVIVEALGDVQSPPLDLDGRHPGVVELLRWLTPNPNLTGHPAIVAAWFESTARVMVQNLGDSPELTAGLRKLLEAKDCMVRAAL